MRNWGVLITAFYIIVLATLAPRLLIPFLLGEHRFDITYGDLYRAWFVWLWIAILIASQLVLLFVHAKPSRKLLSPRRHLFFSIISIAFTMSLLTAAGVLSLALALEHDVDIRLDSPGLQLSLVFLGIWLFWSLVFVLQRKKIFDRTSRLYAWVIKGSVFELLISVPSHVIVRQRDECTSPEASSFGVATGIALMFMSFGPGLLFLYRERIRKHKK